MNKTPVTTESFRVVPTTFPDIPGVEEKREDRGGGVSDLLQVINVPDASCFQLIHLGVDVAGHADVEESPHASDAWPGRPHGAHVRGMHQQLLRAGGREYDIRLLDTGQQVPHQPNVELYSALLQPHTVPSSDTSAGPELRVLDYRW